MNNFLHDIANVHNQVLISVLGAIERTLYGQHIAGCSAGRARCRGALQRLRRGNILRLLASLQLLLKLINSSSLPRYRLILLGYRLIPLGYRLIPLGHIFAQPNQMGVSLPVKRGRCRRLW